MYMFYNLVFIFAISMLLIHEMDAIRCKEWTMLIFFKNMNEERAYQVFTLLHIPMYALLLYFWLNDYLIFYYVVDIILIGHAFLHYGFKNHKNNRMNNVLSKFAINSAAVLSAIHLVGLISKSI